MTMEPLAPSRGGGSQHMKGLPYDPAEDGFVFSKAEVEICKPPSDPPERRPPHRTRPLYAAPRIKSRPQHRGSDLFSGLCSRRRQQFHLRRRQLAMRSNWKIADG